MRLAVCALSAVLLSGCSWLGIGGQNNGYGTSSGAYGGNCAPVQGMAYGQSGYYGQGASDGCEGGAYGVAHGHGQGFGAGQGYGAGAYGAGYGAGQGYGAGAYGAGYGAGQGYGTGAYGAGTGLGQGYGAGAYGAGATGLGGGYGSTAYASSGYGPGGVGAGLAAQGIGGAYGAGGYGAYGTSGVTTLGSAAPYGAAAYGGNVVGTQLNSGQYVNGQYVQNVVGAPIYVPQPYAQPFGVPQLRGVGAALPFGFEVFGGTEFDVTGNLKDGKEIGPAEGGGGRSGAFESVSYSDAFSDGKTLGGAVTYDLNRNMTLIGSAGYSKKEGQSVSSGSFQSGSYNTAGVFTPDVGSTARELTGTFSDLEQYTIEGGVRKYMGNGYGFRPYVGATAGFAYNNDVTLTQTYNDDQTLFGEQEFIDSGWRPTAAGVVGAEMAVGPRAAIGVESGIRWRDNMDAATGGDDRISIPVKLRGRLAF